MQYPRCCASGGGGSEQPGATPHLHSPSSIEQPPSSPQSTASGSHSASLKQISSVAQSSAAWHQARMHPSSSSWMPPHSQSYSGSEQSSGSHSKSGLRSAHTSPPDDEPVASLSVPTLVSSDAGLSLTEVAPVVLSGVETPPIDVVDPLAPASSDVAPSESDPEHDVPRQIASAIETVPELDLDPHLLENRLVLNILVLPERLPSRPRKNAGRAC
jgi:hypothetical protein